MALKIGPCPKCGNTTFIATAHVTQTWLVDEDGDFIEAQSDCDEVTHAPDAEDLFTCSKCGEMALFIKMVFTAHTKSSCSSASSTARTTST